MEMKSRHFIDAPLRMRGTLFPNLNNIQAITPNDQKTTLRNYVSASW